MEAFKVALINEIERMYKKKKAVVIIIISLLVTVLGQLLITAIRSGFGLRGASSIEFPILVLSVFANTILPLFTALVSIDIFAGEFSNNTMKIALIKPVSRFKLFLAKVSAVAFFVLANLMVAMVLSTLTGLIFNSSSATASGFINIIISYVVTMMPVMVLAMMIILLSNVFKSSTAIFFLVIVLFLGSKAFEFIFPQYSSLFVTSMLDWYNLWIVDTMPAAKILRQLLIMLGYGIMFFTAGYYLFDKKDI